MSGRGILVLLLFVLATATTAAATWKKEVWPDRLTGQKRIDMVISGRGSIRQFGHAVTTELILICTHPDDGGADYLSARMVFSEAVTTSEARVRWRIDDGPVSAAKREFSERGDWFALIDNGVTDELTDLRNSSKLRVEISLPWAGDPLIEFDLTGADAAIDQIPCGPR